MLETADLRTYLAEVAALAGLELDELALPREARVEVNGLARALPRMGRSVSPTAGPAARRRADRPHLGHRLPGAAVRLTAVSRPTCAATAIPIGRRRRLLAGRVRARPRRADRAPRRRRLRRDRQFARGADGRALHRQPAAAPSSRPRWSWWTSGPRCAKPDGAPARVYGRAARAGFGRRFRRARPRIQPSAPPRNAAPQPAEQPAPAAVR